MAWVYDLKTDEKIDQALIIPFKAPKSFTGEDTIELHLHGGIWLTQKILDSILDLGASLAKPGEFTERAFLNGKIDLSQAEGILDLIQARTKRAGHNASKLYEGFLGKKIYDLRSKLIDLNSEIIAGIDFPDEVSEKDPDLFKDELIRIISEIDFLLSSEEEGYILREGYRIAIIGQPNAGKSSLLNTLLKSERAIVTNIAGTTRDIIEESFNLNGIPIVLIDTAGLRESEDMVEKIGIKKSYEVISEADLLLRLIDLGFESKNHNEEMFSDLKKLKQIKIGTKLDLLAKEPLLSNKKYQNELSERLELDLVISSKENINIDELKTLIVNKISESFSNTNFKINRRQADLLRKCRDSLSRALDSAELGMAQDFWTIDLKLAIQALGEITGDVITEELLDSIFSKFCIGK